MRDKRNGGMAKVVIITVLCTVLVFALGIIAWYRLGGGSNSLNEASGSSDTGQGGAITTEATTERPPDLPAYEYVEVPTENMRMGELILINSEHAHFDNDVEIVNIYENKNSHYAVSEYEMYAKAVTINRFNALAEALYAEKELDDIIIRSAHRTRALQQKLYENGDPQYVARPGHSEHETGYAMDLGIYDGYSYENFTGEGEYKWVLDNCHKFGFILRYPENKEDITKISYESWHFRYVGEPHAYYIMRNNLCLEEYMDKLQTAMFETEHLFITGHDGVEYEVYLFPADFKAETMIPVPIGREYSISGNNINGFIVTVKCS